jgi:hypothetical protein
MKMPWRRMLGGDRRLPVHLLPTPAEVRHSLTDEAATTRLNALSALAGILALHLSALLPRGTALPAPNVPIFVVNNPVAHGARFAAAVISNLLNLGTSAEIIADRRLSQIAEVETHHFPGVGVRSMLGWVDPESLRFAWRINADRRADSPALSASWCVSTYLVLAQSVRFVLAARAVRGRATPWPVTFTDFDRGVYAAPWVAALKRAGHPVATLVHGAASRDYLPVAASHVFVWGRVQRDFFLASGVGAVDVVGRPDWNMLPIDHTPIRRALICHSMESLSKPEISALSRIAATGHRRGIEVVLRWHPRHRHTGASDGWDVVARAATKVEMAAEALPDVTQPGDLVVVVASTAGVEALCQGLRVLVVADGERSLPCDLAHLGSAVPPSSPETVWEWGSDASARLSEARQAIIAAVGHDSGRLLQQALLRLKGVNV